ncbi:hypothetical protein JMJ77_0005383 [Colletotrichum scovillei]|uniref:Uncharacterized protein n=1 Tax=Colletotrichum scovillei TaxID=1209932 RepID=A0A9P7RIX4_9PEZI|nr:hypothetical protein JMJ77_0005383 [Colletotrichum scovillei]KAG7076600.1 hypothetical protein JMJ76_0013862 [Colletotrichum scovillei]KAG7083708.1 hypothetical protein JMJ78_0009151 [Colletotrichum scovillei]
MVAGTCTTTILPISLRLSVDFCLGGWDEGGGIPSWLCQGADYSLGTWRVAVWPVSSSVWYHLYYLLPPSAGQTIEHRCNGQEAQEISPVLALSGAAADGVSKPAKWPRAISHVPAV